MTPSSRALARHVDWPVLVGMLLIIGLYGAALYLPALEIDDMGKKEVLPGWQALFLGCFLLYDMSAGFFARIIEPGMWLCVSALLFGVLPNLFLWLGLVFLPLGWRHVPWVAGCLGLLNALLWVIAAAALEDWMLPRVFVGFWFWFASMACLVATGVWREWQFPSGR